MSTAPGGAGAATAASATAGGAPGGGPDGGCSRSSPRESGEDSEDDSDVLEESPCGRWLKRREERSGPLNLLSYLRLLAHRETKAKLQNVDQRDVPGIDCSNLAMDTEEGVEVVWNEVQFSERKNFKAQEDKIQLVFDNLTQLEHPNIVKFHRYWTDTHNDKPRVIFITEYMSCGSLKQFLKRMKRNTKKPSLSNWKRWCTQILSALSYLHSRSTPIVHGNLTCDTIFLQHNGLVKIGSVAPDAIHHHVKTCRENMKNMHFCAPEYGAAQLVTPAMDLYSFGMCALEMAALEIQGNGDSGSLVTEENVIKTVESLDESQQKDLIFRCLSTDPQKRPTARELLFHPVLFEVHSLKLLAAHCLVDTTGNIPEIITDEDRNESEALAWATIGGERREFTVADFNKLETDEVKLEKFVEDVKYGIYPLTAYGRGSHGAGAARAASPPEAAESVKSVTPEPLDVESRRITNMMCSIKPKEQGESPELMMTILLRMDDKMNRQLTCVVSRTDTAMLLSQELVHLGFIHETDREKIAKLIEDTLRSSLGSLLGTMSMNAVGPPLMLPAIAPHFAS